MHAPEPLLASVGTPSAGWSLSAKSESGRGNIFLYEDVRWQLITSPGESQVEIRCPSPHCYHRSDHYSTDSDIALKLL